MNKLKKIAYLVLIIIIMILSLTIYTNASKNPEEEQKSKTLSEIKFLESKLVNLMNAINNITYENYGVSVSTEMQNVKQQSGESSSGGESSSNGGGSDSSSSSGGDSSSGDSSSGSSGKEEEVKKFSLKAQSVLTKSDEINWDSIKSEVETIYTSLPSITLDLYQMNLNQEDILGFNNEYDNLTKNVKDEKKQETLTQLSTLYDYIPKFMKNVNVEQIEGIVIQTKAQILKAYAKLESQDWQAIENDVKGAIETYNTLLTSTNIASSNQYKINKAYVMINELQNAVRMQDETVFLIKYKNLLEQLGNM